MRQSAQIDAADCNAAVCVPRRKAHSLGLYVPKRDEGVCKPPFYLRAKNNPASLENRKGKNKVATRKINAARFVRIRLKNPLLYYIILINLEYRAIAEDAENFCNKV